MMTFLVSVTLQDPKFGEVTFTTLIHDERVVVGDRSIQALETQRGLGDSLFALVNAYTVEIYPNRTLPHRLSYTLTDEDPSDEDEGPLALTNPQGYRIPPEQSYDQIVFKWFQPFFLFKVRPYEEGMPLPFDLDATLLDDPTTLGAGDVPALLRQRPERLLRLCLDPRCPPWVLRFLWSFGWVPMQARICLNPNIDRDLVKTAATAYPAVTVLNPQLELLVLEDPALLGVLNPHVALAMRMRQQS